MRIMRVKLPARYANVDVEDDHPRSGIALKIGSTHLHLSPEHALNLADAIVDLVEKNETSMRRS